MGAKNMRKNKDLLVEIEEDLNNNNNNIYSKKNREELVEDDELTNVEAAFMEGYDEAA